MANGGTLQIQGDITVGAEGLTITGAGAASAKGALENVSGTNNYGGLVLLGGNATIASDAGTLNLTSSGTMTGSTFALTLTGAGNGSISSAIGTTSGTVTKTGSGTWILSGNSTYTGNTTVQAGGLVAGTNSAVSTNGAFGNATSAIVLGNASTLSGDAPSLLINGNYTVGRNISVGSGAAATYNATIGGSNTSGTSTFTSNITLNTAASNYTVTLQAATNGTVEFKTGAWNTNNKAIAVGSSGNAGTVKLSNSLTTSGGVNVTSGTLLISSTGSVTSNVTVQSSGSIGGAGTIVGNLILNASSNFVFNLTQTLAVNTGSVSFVGAGGFGVANLFGLDNTAPDATYYLINGNGTINTANLNNVGAGNAAPLLGGGKSAYFQTGAGTLNLVVIPEPSTWALLAASGTFVMVMRRRRR